MKIDRSRFLVLTAALAAGACTVTSSSSDAGGGGTDAQSDVTADVRSDVTADAACDDTVGPGGDCNTLDAGSTCWGEGAANSCLALTKNFKPKVAKSIVDCINGLASCPPGDTVTCLNQATTSACPDPIASTSCSQIGATCGDGGTDGGVSYGDCMQLLAGATQVGRDAFVACMVEGSVCNATECASVFSL
ncbi:MAG: hypothetical protein WCI05_11630 [Myxococcales bacterium]